MPVVKLNPDGLKSSLNKNLVTMYYAPWCKHCRTLKPVYEKFATHAENNMPGIHVVAVDMDKHGRKIKAETIGFSEFGMPIADQVEGFPTVILSKRGRFLKLPPVTHTSESLVSAATSFF